VPQVSFEDGIIAVEMGIKAQLDVSNKVDEDDYASMRPLNALSSQSCDLLLNHAIDMAQMQSKISLISELGDIVAESKGQ
jgi:hypothetical protein